MMQNKYEVTNEVRDQIIKDYLMKSYHWTIGLGMFIIGILIGVLVSG